MEQKVGTRNDDKAEEHMEREIGVGTSMRSKSIFGTKSQRVPEVRCDFQKVPMCYR
jgi:hypothetical protein